MSAHLVECTAYNERRSASSSFVQAVFFTEGESECSQRFIRPSKIKLSLLHAVVIVLHTFLHALLVLPGTESAIVFHMSVSP
jgi:hypothetical protein